MLRDDGCSAVLALLDDARTHADVRARCKCIMDTMEEHGFTSAR